MGRVTFLFFAVFVCLIAASDASAITVGYATDVPGYAPPGQQELQLASLTLGGVTVTGSNTLNLLELNGMGVVGGFNFQVDDVEWVEFHFDNGPAESVSIFDTLGNAADGHTVEIFDASNVSLGVFNFPNGGGGISGPLDVSAFVGNAPIGKFRFNSVSGASEIAYLDYTPLPEPASIALITIVAASLTCRRRLRTRHR